VSGTDVSVIIPVWNGRRYLEACLDALLEQEPPGFEIVLVDNASTDGSVELIQERYRAARLIQNADNLGFAGACNVGLQAARGRILILLNQDTRVLAGWLATLVEVARQPQVGVVGCKALYPDGETIQHAGGQIEWPRGVGRHYGGGERDAGQWDVARPVDFCTGAAIAFRREVLKEIGLLDEGFWPGYYEDSDFCFRAREAGYQVCYAPDAVMIHKESPSLRGTRELSVAFHRGRLRFVLKHLAPERFLEEFVPAERAELLAAGEGEAGQVLRSVYLEAIPVAAALLPRRWKADAGTTDRVLMALHRLYLEPAPGREPPGVALAEFRFRSQVPLVGPAIARLRSLWYDMAARWGVRYLGQQQEAINRHYRARIEEEEAMRRHAVRALVSLSQEVARVIRQLEAEREDNG
jgi:GT2 family glycosyltransferase